MSALFSPIVGLLHNVKLNRWHPVVFRESPLPGPPGPDVPVRHKSHGHHTGGFETRNEALASAREMAVELVTTHTAIGKVSLALDADFPWDGEGIPAMVRFFHVEGDKATPMF